MNRIDRLTAIIIFLQGRQRVSIAELSDRYKISERTVYRDLVALQEAGVPIGSEPGEGYYIVKGYHLPPVMFNRQEAASLLAGERLMRKWNQTELGKSYLSALDKIRSILPPDEKEYFEVLDERIQTFKYQNVNFPKPDERIFGFLQNAIFKKEIIEIEYRSPHMQKRTTRKVEPLGLLLMGSHWYLAAWCRLREDYRMFRLDRFDKFKTTGIQIRQPTGHSLKNFYDRNLHQERELTEVVVWFEAEYASYVGDQKYWHGWAWERSVDGGIEMTFLTSSVSYLCRWLLMWGNKMTIQKCDEAKKKMREFVDQLHQHHT
ncbi:helix-turn-helix transcriptional regulator [Rhodohalobacter sp. 614A]|uniref:helix-turn-helix transcriptional regulator n=1 Tax=Rhodohalobacter sp. 614A TaxID=2908649 RepID=UPI001F25DC17|nr:YafY family protein [Rhodohalobacter sp. 614A]